MSYTLGIDLGGTKIRVALVKDGTIIDKKETLTEAELGPNQGIEKIINLIKEVDPNRLAKAIGVGSPGPLDTKNGIILDAPNLLGWCGTNICKILKEHTGYYVRIENDANVAGLAEALYGSGIGKEIVQYITVSTGVGGGLVINGKIISGAQGCTSEIGAMIVSSEDRYHEVLPKGSLETLCSGTAISKVASIKLCRKVSAKEVFELYHKDDEVCKEIISNWIEDFSAGIANLVHVINPDLFVIGGSVITNNPWILKEVKEAAAKKVYPSLSNHINIALPQFSDIAGIIGAASLVRKA